MSDILFCSSCTRNKPKSAFHRSKGERSGYKTICAVCLNAAARHWYVINSADQRSKARARYVARKLRKASK